MTMKLGAKGQVVIPKAIRDEAGLYPGDAVDFEFRDGEVVLVRSERQRRPLRGRYADSNILAEHEAEHAREVARDRW